MFYTDHLYLVAKRKKVEDTRRPVSLAVRLRQIIPPRTIKD